MSQSLYRIICSEDGDWYIAAKKEGQEIRILGEGHFPSDALKAILKDAGIDAPCVTRKVAEDGSYTPKLKDWK